MAKVENCSSNSSCYGSPPTTEERLYTEVIITVAVEVFLLFLCVIAIIVSLVKKMYYKKRGRERAKNQGAVKQRFHITDRPNPQWTSQDEHNPEDTSVQSGVENSSEEMAISSDYQMSDRVGLRQISTKLQPPPCAYVNVEEDQPPVHSAENRTATETTDITSTDLQHEFPIDSVREFSEKSAYINEDTTETQCWTTDNGNKIELSENDPVYDKPLFTGGTGDNSKQSKQVPKNTLLPSSSISITSNPSYLPLEVCSPCHPWEQEYVVDTTPNKSPDPLQLEIGTNPCYIPSEQGEEAEGGCYDYVPEDRVFFKLPVHNQPCH